MRTFRAPKPTQRDLGVDTLPVLGRESCVQGGVDGAGEHSVHSHALPVDTIIFLILGEHFRSIMRTALNKRSSDRGEHHPEKMKEEKSSPKKR